MALFKIRNLMVQRIDNPSRRLSLSTFYSYITHATLKGYMFNGGMGCWGGAGVGSVSHELRFYSNNTVGRKLWEGMVGSVGGVGEVGGR